ncbi:glycosyltransferase family 1 protein [Marinobacter sp.]|uniref:glycosyltransferase family 4 protein n=1 Tax=Marinobacter sp. TaxID=50741 RepID=UPI002B26F992|nr:glycosyltransferase family 1 protein [Marinobacter sp.]
MTETIRPGRHRQQITIVSETFPPEINGVANTLRYLCLGLVDRGHQVTVVRPRQSHEQTGLYPNTGSQLFSHELLVGGIPIPGYTEFRFGITRPATLVTLWQNNRPDCIYVATQGPLGVAAVAAAKRLNIPVLSGFHTNFHSYSRYYGLGAIERILSTYGRWFHNRTLRTLAPTRNTIAAAQTMGINNTELWSRGVDCERFTPQKRSQALRHRWGLKENDLAILYVGRLAPEKNLPLAVVCFERIRKLYPNARFVLVGDGPMRANLEERHPDFIFCGMQSGENLPQHYASGDLFLFPSKTDTFGNVVLEAMASGLGVIAFNDAAASEHIRHNDNGMKAPLHNDDNFVHHALKLADQPSLLRRVRTKARLDTLDLNWNHQIEQFERLAFNPYTQASHHAPSKQSFPVL